MYTSTAFKWDQDTVEEQEFAFLFATLEASMKTENCPYFLSAACLNSIKNYFNDFTIKFQGDLHDRAVALGKLASNQKVLDFLQIF